MRKNLGRIQCTGREMVLTVKVEKDMTSLFSQLKQNAEKCGSRPPPS